MSFINVEDLPDSKEEEEKPQIRLELVRIEKLPAEHKKKWKAHFNIIEGKGRKRKVKKKSVSFGQQGAEDYTMHKDKERRTAYRLRHKRDKIDNPLAPGSLSWYILWSATTMKQAIRNYGASHKNLKIKKSVYDSLQ